MNPLPCSHISGPKDRAWEGATFPEPPENFWLDTRSPRPLCGRILAPSLTALGQAWVEDPLTSQATHSRRFSESKVAPGFHSSWLGGQEEDHGRLCDFLPMNFTHCILEPRGRQGSFVWRGQRGQEMSIFPNHKHTFSLQMYTEAK